MLYLFLPTNNFIPKTSHKGHKEREDHKEEKEVSGVITREFFF
jgi:hypothetical protein